MIPLDAIVKVVSLTDVDYPDRDYSRLGTILLCDYRGCVTYPDRTHTQAAFTFPRWFDPDGCCVYDGLTYLWVKNEDLQIVSLDFCQL
jgi:hypothetical protein